MAVLQLIQCLKGHEEQVWNVAWNAQGSLLASCGTDKCVRIWGLEGDDWVLKSTLVGSHTRTIRTVSWSPCGNYLSSTSFDATTCIWSKSKGEFECIATLEGHENEVKSSSWSTSGAYLATCSRDKTVWIWEVDDDHEDFECASVLNSHSQDVKRVVWHPSKEILASCSYDNTIQFYIEESDDWSEYDTLDSHQSTVWSICFDRSGERLVSCSDDTTVKIWREYQPGNDVGIATTGKYPRWKCICTIQGFHNRPIYDVSWCPLSDVIATACGDDYIRVFCEEGDSPHEPSFKLGASVAKAHDGDVNCVAWNSKRRGLLASCGDDGMIKLWQYQPS